MNITAFRYEDSIIVVDLGMSFPTDDMLGVDLVIPDITYLLENKELVRGIFITHGHEDHIGAIPYIIGQLGAPLYATRLTMGIIEHKLEEHLLLESTERHVVQFGDRIGAGAFSVEYIRTNHSIVDAAALAITSPAGTVVHTGDFKVDYTPVFGDPIDLQRFAQIGKEGVLALLCDSTNAERPGFTASEKTVGHTFDQLFQECLDKRIIVATFASNVDRVQQIINSASKFGRKVVVEGRSMINIITIAQELGCIRIPDNTIIDVEQLKNYPENKTVIITTGSQGENMAALSRMATGQHRKITIGQGDTVILSSHPIPGNEKAVMSVINDLLLKGADVISQDVHVSGHACQEDIKLIYTLVQPQFAVPVHGEYKHLIAQGKLATELGIPKKNVFILRSGEVLELNRFGAQISQDHVTVGEVLVDGKGVGDVGNAVLRDRQHLSESGIVIACAVVDKETGELIGEPEIESRGFVYMREANELIDDCRDLVREELAHALDKGIRDTNKLRGILRDELAGFLWRRTERRPIILSMIMDVRA
ncbi:MAG: ribonuclease J [Lachnospiraceae bacterium]|nr:ribonuclease J [Lachnospiraceae bacterium]